MVLQYLVPISPPNLVRKEVEYTSSDLRSKELRLLCVDGAPGLRNMFSVDLCYAHANELKVDEFPPVILYKACSTYFLWPTPLVSPISVRSGRQEMRTRA